MAIIKYFVERRFIKVIFSKVHNATGGISTGCKLSLPKKWMDIMGLTTDSRQVCVDFDPEQKSIVIRKAENYNKLVLSKDILIKLGVKSDNEFSVDYNNKNRTIILTKKQKGDHYEAI